MSTETTTVEAPEAKPTGKVTSPTDIVWPFDQFGITTMTRKEGVRAIGRINGNDEKLEVFITTLKVLGEYAKTKLGAQKARQAEIAAQEAERDRLQAEHAVKVQEEAVQRQNQIAAAAAEKLENMKAALPKED